MEKVLLASFTAVESAHAFSAFCPSVFTIKEFVGQNPAKKNEIRLGYVPAVIFAVALGFIVSKIIKSWMPLLFALGTCGFMVASYEVAMR